MIIIFYYYSSLPSQTTSPSSCLPPASTRWQSIPWSAAWRPDCGRTRWGGRKTTPQKRTIWEWWRPPRDRRGPAAAFCFSSISIDSFTFRSYSSVEAQPSPPLPFTLQARLKGTSNKQDCTESLHCRLQPEPAGNGVRLRTSASQRCSRPPEECMCCAVSLVLQAVLSYPLSVIYRKVATLSSESKTKKEKFSVQTTQWILNCISQFCLKNLWEKLDR